MKTRTSQSSFYTKRMSVATRCLKMGYSGVFTKENTKYFCFGGTGGGGEVSGPRTPGNSSLLKSY